VCGALARARRPCGPFHAERRQRSTVYIMLAVICGIKKIFF
jgi:hypothetical protein